MTLRSFCALCLLALALPLIPAEAQQRKPSRPTKPAARTRSFSAFVNQYLTDFARRHPSIAAGNGIHTFDGTLDDFSATAIQKEIAALKRDRVTLRKFSTKRLTANQRVDRRILDGIIDGWLLEQETLQNWKRNPMVYASALSDGVHNLMTMTNAPAATRMRRMISKLNATPKFFDAARANVTNPPRLFAERGVAMFKGASAMLGNDVALAFAQQAGTPLMDSLTEATTAAKILVDDYVRFLEHDIIPQARGDFVIGGDAVARRYRAEELIDVPLDTLLKIGQRELVKSQGDFKSAARRISISKDAQDVWREIRQDHPKRGEVVAAAQRIVDSLTDFVRSKKLASIPTKERVTVRAAQPFDLGLASMHASPPLERVPLQSVYYITDANANDSPEQQDAWLERFNLASLAVTTAHEAMPGHWLHSQFMRKTPGKVRRIWIGLNPFPQPSSGQDGWAHYAEQLIAEQGYAKSDPRVQMAQISDALTRICRLMSGINVHRGVWTLERAQECFEKDAYVAAPAAKREAERATYDPTYGGYFLGKRGLLTLRADMQKKLGAKFSLRAFHERVMSNGIAPIAAHRQLLLPGDRRAVIR